MGTGEKVLVIDDSPEITRLLRNILSREGYQVSVSNDPEAALLLLEQERPHLVILDICMPHLDGWEVCRRIREVSSVPILMLTVLSESPNVERSLRAGADAYMTKPFSISALLERVHSLLGRYPARPSGIRKI
ncbi:MAG: response regulator transcription factor [Chloroflexia bacterium]